jgi:hypothetical protein
MWWGVLGNTILACLGVSYAFPSRSLGTRQKGSVPFIPWDKRVASPLSPLYPLYPTKKVDWLNHTCIDENYDLTKPNGEEKDIKFICNLFIHSYVFVVSGDGKLEGVYVSTDRVKPEST